MDGSITTICTIITGVFVVLAAYLGAIHANYLNKQAEKRNEENFEKSIIQSIQSELQTLHDLYINIFVNGLESLEQGEFYTWTWTARQDFFSVYHSNGFFLGKIRDEILRKTIIKTYITLKKFLENLLDYTEDYKKFTIKKENMLLILNNMASFYINSQQLEHILSLNLRVKAALINLNINCNDEDIIRNLEKDKSYILEQRQYLIGYTSRLKEEFAILKIEMENCLKLIEEYLTK
jgi:hypothetical protein